MSADVVELTRELVEIRTVNPPGDEEKAASLLAARLEAAGFSVASYEFAPGRTSLVARLPGDGPSLCLTGHLDTVPLGRADWSVDPFSGETDGDRLFGRGTSDMKGGTAAIVVAAERLARAGGSGLELVLCAGEETGCEGALALAREEGALGECGAVLVAEPTTNYPCVAHKGVVWADAVARGKTAHGSMPHLGENAIYPLAQAILSLQDLSFDAEHPLLGAPTISLGTFSGGININSVPDRAEAGIDVRTVPGLSSDAVLDALRERLGEGIELSPRVALDPIDTDPSGDWVQTVFSVMGPLIGETPEPRGLAYFTDAAALSPAYGNPPTIICGPGDAEQAHRTDESCSMEALEAAGEGFFEIAKRWCGALGQRRLDRRRRPQHRRLVEPDELHADRHPGRAGEPRHADRRHAEQRPRAAQQRVAGVALAAQRRLAERGGDEQARPSRPATPRATRGRERGGRPPLPLPRPPDRARCTRASPGRGRRGGRGTPARGCGRRHAPSAPPAPRGARRTAAGSSSSSRADPPRRLLHLGRLVHPRRAAERDPRLAGGGLEAGEQRGVGDRAAEGAERVEPRAEALDAGGRRPAVARA